MRACRRRAPGSPASSGSERVGGKCWRRLRLKGLIDAVLLEANHAAEALKIVRENDEPIDLVVSDVAMPGNMNGIEMAAQLSNAHPKMKVVVMSGYQPEALAMEPSWYFIEKPFSASEVSSEDS